MRDPRSAERGEIVLWDIDTGSFTSATSGHDHGIRDVAFHPSKREVLLAGNDTCLYLWEYSETGQLSPGYVRKFLGKGIIGEVKFNSTGTRFATRGDGGIYVWDYSKEQGPMRVSCHPGSGAFSTAISPDGKLLATGGSPGVVKLTELETGKEIGEFLGMETGINFVVFELAFSPDGKRLAAVGRGMERQGMLWDVETRKKIGEFSTTGKVEGVDHLNLRTVAFHPNGKYIVTGGTGNLIRVWDSDNGNLLHELPLATSEISKLAFSPDGRLGVCGKPVVEGKSFFAAIVNPENGKTMLSFEDVTSPAQIAFSRDPEGSWIAFGGPHPVVDVFDSRTGAKRASLVGHDSCIKSIAFHPNGNRIVTCSDDSTFRIWELDSGRELLVRHDHQGGIEALCISPDGKKLVTGGWGNTIYIWNIDSEVNPKTERPDHIFKQQ